MAFQHGLGVGSFEIRDIIHNGNLIQVPQRIGTFNGTQVNAIFPQAGMNWVNLSLPYDATGGFGGTSIDFIVPQDEWYVGPLWLIAYGSGTVTQQGNSVSSVSMASNLTYGFTYDPRGGMTPVLGDEVPSGGTVFDPNPQLALNAKFQPMWRLPKGKWYRISN